MGYFKKFFQGDKFVLKNSIQWMPIVIIDVFRKILYCEFANKYVLSNFAK